MTKLSFDIILLGGGLVGLTCANLCADSGLSVAVIEATPPTLHWSTETIDSRCSAISKGSQQIFEKTGVWKTICDMRISAYQHMMVWDSISSGSIEFDAAEVSEDCLGYIIENRVMLKALWEKAKAHSNIHIFSPAMPKSYLMDNEKITLELEDNTSLKAKLVIGADGGQSWLRDKAMLETVKRSYQQTAVVATVKTEMSHQQTAWQRFLPEGPLAFLPLADPNTCSIVWTATEEKIQALLNMQTTEFCDSLSLHFDYRLGKVVSSSDRFSFPLTMIYAKHSITERIALIGDAAHVIHPLAGQGVNLGLADANALAEVLSYAKQYDYDIGHYLVLRKYERARRGPILTMLAAMEFFKRTFGSSNSILAGVRSIGLNLVNKNPFLKRQIIFKAMGF